MREYQRTSRDPGLQPERTGLVEDVADKHSRRLLFAIAGIVVVVAVLEIYRLLSRRTMYGF